MLIPLPDELQELLVELHECDGLVDESEYSEIANERLHKLRELGLVQLSWRLLPAGEKRCKIV